MQRFLHREGGDIMSDRKKPSESTATIVRTEGLGTITEITPEAKEPTLAQGINGAVLKAANKTSTDKEVAALAAAHLAEGELEPQTGRKSAASLLVELATDRYSLGVSQDSEPFAIPRSIRTHIVLRLRGDKMSLRTSLAREYFKNTGRAASQQALADAMLVLEGMAQEESPTVLNLRVAEAEGALWIDLGGTTGRIIRITGDGWDICDTAPVLFQRTVLSGELPEPIPGSDIDDLWQFLNVNMEDRPLLLAAMIACYFPAIPHPVLIFAGEQGTAKSTHARMLVDLLDPSPVPLRKPPRDAEAWVTAASGSWVVSIDNVSTIPPWFSDSLCRAVTGDGDVRRALYTDGQLAVFAFRRCIILTGIDFGGLRGDLSERLLMVELERISDAKRLEEADLNARWQVARPRLLGALLSLVAGVKRVSPSLRLESKPRMADFARILAAVDQLLGTQGSAHYLGQSSELAADTLSTSPFIVRMQETMTTGFEGTAAELLKLVTPEWEGWRAPRDWPRNARAVTTLLKSDGPAFRKNGWVIDTLGLDRTKITRWRVTPPEIACNPSLQHLQNPHLAGVAGVAGVQYGSSQVEQVDDEELF